EVKHLIVKVSQYYQTSMMIYYHFGDLQSALRYAQTALRYAEMFSDPERGFCTGLRTDLRK
ncbi:hypothetical protein QBC46DRAFT_229809, partial [Diplogelasinospora grovesii]